MKIAQALLLRKQLEQKVQQLQPIKQLGAQGLFEVKTQRRNVSADTDEITFQVPKVTLAEVTKEYDKYATALRKLDAAVQKANWEFDVDFTDAENPIEAA
jgi:hypothetical protein